MITQEACFTTQLVGRDQIIEEANNKIIQQQNDWNTEKAELEQQCAEIRKIYEQRWLDPYVAEAKLMQAEGATNVVITDLRKRLAAAQFDVSITQVKVHAIITRHRLNTLKPVDESLQKGWKTWSAQAAELQLLRADRENRKPHGSSFFKMSEEAIATVQEDIAKDIYEIAAFYKEEINRIMQEFDKHDVDTSVQLDHIEAERVSKTLGLGALETAQPRSSTEQTHAETDNEEDTEDDDEDAEFEPRHEGEPSLFDILDYDTDGDSDEDQQE